LGATIGIAGGVIGALAGLFAVSMPARARSSAISYSYFYSSGFLEIDVPAMVRANRLMPSG